MNPDIQACAELVARGDPERFRATMASPLTARERLFPLFALNLEVARAPWVASEPMIAEMRLQFWRDVVEAAATTDAPPRAHEVAAPVTGVIRAHRLPHDVLDRLIAARRWDIYRDAHEDEAALDQYLQDTGGGLVWLAALSLGAPPSQEGTFRAFGQAAALAALFRAVPELEVRGRVPLIDGRAEAVSARAKSALQAIKNVKKSGIPRALQPALWSMWWAESVLRKAATTPTLVAMDGLEVSPLALSLGLARRSLLGQI